MRPEIIFQNIRDLMVFGSAMTTSELSGVTTCTTDNIYTLEDGMLVEIQNKVFPVSNITRTGVAEWTFEITATGITAISWELALYYLPGRALEINNVQKDKKEDPSNKNKRFPLMWLLTGMEKNENFEEPVAYESNVIIAFVYISEDNLRTQKRIDDKYEPILDPLVELFKNTIKKSPGSRYFSLPYGETLDITTTDKFKYGSIDGNKNIFVDIADAIELNMNLKFFETITCN